MRPVAGRQGFWFGYDDSSGWLVPELLFDADRGSRVIREIGAVTSDSGFWGLAVWPDAINYCTETLYDFSAYTGISFWAKNATGAALRLTVRDGATASGTDTETITSPTVPLTLTTSWAFYKVHWTDLVRPSDQTLALPQSIGIIKWEWAETNAVFDLSLDDVGFFSD